MRIDWYTKIVLTVIAACLVALVLSGSGIMPLAQAQYGAQDVRIIGTGLTPLNVKIVEIAERYDGDWEGLPVKIEDVRRGIRNGLPVEVQ